MSKKENPRIRKARKALSGRLDRILDVYEDTRFVEITGRSGGDTLTFRVYDCGTITER